MRPSQKLFRTSAVLLLGATVAWSLSSLLPGFARAFYAPHAPALSFSPAAGFGGTDAISPDTAPAGSPLTFSVVYTHPDNHPPIIVLPVLFRLPSLMHTALAHEDNGEEEAVKLFVSTTNFSFFTELKMYRDTVPDPSFPHLHDGDYTNGEQFSLTIPAGFPYAADYEFYFQATDGEFGHFRTFGRRSTGGPFTFTLTAPLPTNHAPALSFADAAGYEVDGANPDHGAADLTPFTFKAIYADEDNDPPQDISLHIDTGSVDLDPVPLIPDTDPAAPSVLKDGNYANGEQFMYSATFPRGQYQYHFTASDGEEEARLPANGELAFTVDLQPLILIPGIAGSELRHNGEEIWMNMGKMLTDRGDDFLDVLAMDAQGVSVENIEVGDIIRQKLPIIIWSRLVEDLESAGYTEDQNLFVFPYDWRADNRMAAEQLDSFIASVTAQTASPKIDLVVHSMGGLVAKSYITEHGESRIDQLVFMGTPHYGAPKALKVLLYGDQFGIPVLDPAALQRIAGNMASVYQLLPSEAYMDDQETYFIDWADIDHDGITGRLGFAATKALIGNMGLIETLRDGADSLHDELDAWAPTPALQARTHNIVGCAVGTPGTFITYQDKDRDGVLLRTVGGDETVPLASARKAAAGSTYYIPDARHSRMPDHALIRQLVRDILDDNAVDILDPAYEDIQQGAGNCGFTATAHGVHSPVILYAYDGQGRHTGPNAAGGIDEEIPGSSYVALGEDKFLILPKGSEATVRLEGTGEGVFRYDISDIAETGEQTSARFFDMPVTLKTKGKVVFDEQDVGSAIIMLDQDGDGVYEQSFAPASVLDAAGAEDATAPVVTLASPEPDAAIAHHESLALKGTVADDTAPITAVIYVDGAEVSVRTAIGAPLMLAHTIDMPTLPLGDHTLSVEARDAAGNYTTAVLPFTIIATPASILGLIEWGSSHGWYRYPFVSQILRSAASPILTLIDGRPLPPQMRRAKIAAIDTFGKLLERLVKQGMLTKEGKDILQGDLEYIKGQL